MNQQNNAGAAALRVMSSNSMQGSMRELLPQFERVTGQRVAISYDPAKFMMERIARGESADLLIINAQSIQELGRQGKIVPSSARHLALVKAGVAVRKGAPRPDIGTSDALKQSLLNAKSVAYTGAGVSGMHFAKVVERLGIAAQIRAKARIRDGGLIGELVAAGDAELAVQQIPELAAVDGIDIVGPLPEELQITTIVTAAVFSDAQQTRAAHALLEFLTTAAAASVFKRKGYEAAPGNSA